jgi:hypothetical protein
MPTANRPLFKIVDGLRIAIVGMVAMVLIGCAPPQPPSAPRPNLRVDLRPVDKTAFERVVFENTGRVVLVNFWALWDQSSMRQLAHMKVLQDIYGQDGLQVILVSLDNEPAVENVVQFLQAMRAVGLTYLISANGAEAQSFEDFGIPDGKLPCYMLYDRMGNRGRVYSGPIDGIEQEIDKLLRQTEFESVTPMGE